MKIGTDGVLLGAWVNLDFFDEERFYRALDVGTGTGIIALMMAQRNENLHIDAIEKDADAYVQCCGNFQDSPFGDRIFAKLSSFQDFETDARYDLIVSNPPYFSNSLKSPDGKRNTARHNDGLSLKMLIESSLRMLADDGRLALILPADSLEELDVLIAVNRLYVARRTDVVTVEGQQAKRFMTELTRYQVHQPVHENLILETEIHKKTHDYQELTKDFYMK